MADTKKQDEAVAERDGVTTLQSNIKVNTSKMQDYSLFLGGLNVKRAALEQYDVLKTGKSRIFLTKMPKFMKQLMKNATNNFKHVVEYGFLNIDGIQDLTMEFESITGGYAGRTFEIPTILKDDTNEVTIRLLEFSGSPMREYIEMWLTGVADPNSGLTHYHGLALPNPKNANNKPDLEVSQGNHTMEAIYVVTDATGCNIEFACMLCNMFPKGSVRSHFNYESGTSAHVEIDVAFTCTMYTSPDINAVAQLLLNKYKVLSSYLEFDSGTGTEIKNEKGEVVGKSLDDNEFPDSKIKDWTIK